MANWFCTSVDAHGGVMARPMGGGGEEYFGIGDPRNAYDAEVSHESVIALDIDDHTVLLADEHLRDLWVAFEAREAGKR